MNMISIETLKTLSYELKQHRFENDKSKSFYLSSNIAYGTDRRIKESVTFIEPVSEALDLGRNTLSNDTIWTKNKSNSILEEDIFKNCIKMATDLGDKDKLTESKRLYYKYNKILKSVDKLRKAIKTRRRASYYEERLEEKQIKDEKEWEEKIKIKNYILRDVERKISEIKQKRDM